MSVFLKNIDSEFGPNAPKGHFWVNNELRKKWGQTCIFGSGKIEVFGPCKFVKYNHGIPLR